jgi:hypothetical protein
MNKTFLSLAAMLVSLCSISLAQTVSFTGSALVSPSSSSNPLGLSAGQVGVFINNDNLSLWSGFNGTGKINSGLSLLSSATYTPVGTSDAFTYLGNNAVTGTTTFSLSGGIASISLSGGVGTGDQYAVIVFNSSTTTTIAGDSYRVFRASDWLIPSSGSSIGYSTTPNASAYQQIRDTSFVIASGTVVPEPSTYALLAMSGLALGGYVMRRRRRA